MIIAHLEAFVADSLATVCLGNPLLLETKKAGADAMKKYGVTSILSLSYEQLDQLVADAIWDIMRKSTDAYLAYFQNELALPIIVNAKLLYRASLDRHAILHNGGLMNQEKYIDKLNDKERVGLEAGTQIHINMEYVIEVYNLVLSLGEAIFEAISKKYFAIIEPLKDRERIPKIQSPNLKRNPFEEMAHQAVINVGGADAAIANPQEVRAELIKLMMKKRSDL